MHPGYDPETGGPDGDQLSNPSTRSKETVMKRYGTLLMAAAVAVALGAPRAWAAPVAKEPTKKQINSITKTSATAPATAPRQISRNRNAL